MVLLALGELVQSAQDRFEQNTMPVVMLVLVSTRAGMKVRQVAKQTIERSNLIATH